MDYSYIFPDFTDKLEYVQTIYHNTNEVYQIQANINDKQLIQTNAPQMPSLIADLVDLATSIYVADWRSPRKQPDPHQIYISLPLRNPDVFSGTKAMAHLQDLLQWYTGDDWYFEFKPRLKPGRFAERSHKLSLSYPHECIEVALWSGGLDSLAGLYNRLVEESLVQYTLFGTGSNDSIKGKQREIAEAIKGNFPYRIKLIQVPIEIHYPDPEKPPTNDLFRARGFVFKLLGSVCAYLEGQQALYIYENGFGAINLPYKLSEVGLAHTRSVHPLSLSKMGNFVSQLLNVPFSCENPFLFWTKAQNV